MATVGLYGSSSSGVVAAASGSESIGLYGNGTSFGGSYFEWFIFQVADTQPATPTGGSWDFTTNTGTPPAGWSVTPPAAPTNTVWVSIALVNSKNASNLTWSAPGKFSYSSGLPILSGNGTPGPSVGQSDQLYVQLDTTPQTIWFKESGTWTRLTGSTLYVDTTSNQTIAGTKTFSSQIQGSVSGTAANVTGIVAVANGGTGVTTSTGSGNVVLSNSPTLSAPTISNYEAFTPSTAPTYAEGLTWYDSASNALSYYNSTTNNAVHIGQEIQQQVRNSTGSTITKGQVVYISGSTGQIGNVILAQANAYVSSQVIGVANQDIPNNTNGWIVTQGTVSNINTSGFTAGNPLYLSATTAGAMTQTEPSTPNYSVHMGVCLYSNVNNGKIYICPINRSIDTGYIIGQVAVAQGGTGTSTPSLVAGTNVSITGTWPNQTISSSNPGGTVTSVAATVPSFLTVTGSPITSSGTLAISYSGTALPVANGGTGVTTSTGTGSVVLSTSPTLVTPALGTPTSGNFSTGTFTWPTFNQNTTGTASNVTGIVAIANGGTGATTAAGAATNLGLGTGNSPTFTGLTLSGGTANGVAYLNGSKVVTTGSGLVYDGSSLTLGSATKQLGTVNNFWANSATAANGGIGLSPDSKGAGSHSVVSYIGGSTFTQLNLEGSQIGFYLGTTGLSSEQMRLTSTGLLIGMSSLVGAAKLQINGDASVVGGNKLYLWNAANNSAPYLNSPAASAIAFYDTSSVELMRINQTGLGIGTSSPGYKLDVQSTAAIAGRVKSTYTAASKTYTSFLIGNAAGYQGGAIGYVQDGVTASNSFFHLTPYGVNEGDALNVNQSGYVGIGTSLPAEKLDIYLNSTSNVSAKVGNTSGSIQLLQSNGIAYLYTAANQAIAFSTNNTERARIDSSGNLLVGTTSGSYKFQVEAAANLADFYSTTYAAELSIKSSSTNVISLVGGTGDSIAFETGGSERARYDSSGNYWFGGAYGTSVASGIAITNPTSATTLYIGHAVGSSSGSVYEEYRYNTTTIGSITQNGTTGVLYNITSDYRLKNVLGAVTGAGARIDALEPIEYEWKSDGTRTRGFLAHKFQEVYPHSVTGEKDAVDAEGNPVYQQMQGSTNEVIADLVAEIQSLRARVAQLEGN